jgi:predicted  nucleic acid-binding Zn-ribbon protein
MRFNDNQSGLFSFMVGCIIVVMTGVGISLMVDRRFSFSKGVTGLQRDMETGETELEQLKSDYQENSSQLARESKQQMLAENHQALVRQIQQLEQRRTVLEASLKDLQTANHAMQDEFLKYKEKYRSQVRAEAVGQSLGNLIVRGGREYRKAVIVGVTDVGLEISHEEGRARVQAPDLDPALQERFQWNDEERRTRLKQELLQQETEPGGPAAMREKDTPTEKPTRLNREADVPDAEKLEALRRQVSAWKSRVAQLTSELHEARSKVAAGRQVSVPGSLETWQARAGRLGNELAKAKGELAATKAVLAALAPDDPVLRPGK